MTVPLLQLQQEELAEAMGGQPRFRAGQVFAWLHRGVAPEEMTNLPKALREWVAEQGTGGVVVQEVRVAGDGTRKYLFRMGDGELVEGVLMRYHYGNTLCISTQVGCRMGCRFCASTLEGLVRNLLAHEILGQVVAVNRELGGGIGQDRAITNLVLMGSGEPLDNYDETLRFLGLVTAAGGLNFGVRNISLSTCGLVPGIRRLAQSGYPVTLSLSLHAPNDGIRRQLMPVANAYTVAQCLEACRDYARQTGRRIIVEYALVSGVNDGLEQARELATRLRGLNCHVNLIGLNDVRETGLRGAPKAGVQRFLQALEAQGISATLRREMGSDIEGACGQLRRRVLKEGSRCDLQH